jgi:hypothetical protein
MGVSGNRGVVADVEFADEMVLSELIDTRYSGKDGSGAWGMSASGDAGPRLRSTMEGVWVMVGGVGTGGVSAKGDVPPMVGVKGEECRRLYILLGTVMICPGALGSSNAKNAKTPAVEGFLLIAAALERVRSRLLPIPGAKSSIKPNEVSPNTCWSFLFFRRRSERSSCDKVFVVGGLLSGRAGGISCVDCEAFGEVGRCRDAGRRWREGLGESDLGSGGGGVVVLFCAAFSEAVEPRRWWSLESLLLTATTAVEMLVVLPNTRFRIPPRAFALGSSELDSAVSPDPLLVIPKS